MSCIKAVCAAFFVLLLLAGGSYAFGEIDSTYIIFHFHGADTSSSLGANLNCLGDINGGVDVTEHRTFKMSLTVA